MATGETTETAEEAKSPGWSMWLTCKSMRAKFPSVRQIATDELDRLLKAQQASGGSNEMASGAKKKQRSYSYTDMEAALSAAKIGQDKVTVYGLSKTYGIPISTLNDRLNGRSGEVMGRPSVLTEEEETALCEYAKYFADRGFPLTVLLLDSRPVEEYSISHIPDAVRVDHGGDLTPALDRIRQENDTSRPLAVVAYCSVGYRSSVVAKRLEEELKKLPSGNSNRPISIYNLEGSLFKWANEGRAMEDSECKTTTLAHPYSSLWGRLLNKQLHCWSR
ncbi:Hypp520 [Branchiostoma lanceolatum]|uniref:Hypp520 protein n=1 Tax=Branchiostoma lanceolatum TaxID=7740 RepID=A0A8J9VAH0_BRALA|nr:Hypp520 [Branchiostoma lanceolatum]